MCAIVRMYKHIRALDCLVSLGCCQQSSDATCWAHNMLHKQTGVEKDTAELAYHINAMQGAHTFTISGLPKKKARNDMNVYAKTKSLIGACFLDRLRFLGCLGRLVFITEACKEDPLLHSRQQAFVIETLGVDGSGFQFLF